MAKKQKPQKSVEAPALAAQVQERRVLQPVAAVGAAGASTLGHLEGYAAVFSEETLIRSAQGTWRERIAPTAFDDALGRDEVIATFNHDTALLLGRTSNRSLTLSTDKIGLKYRIAVPDTSLGRDVKALVARGDLVGSSFRFSVAQGDVEVIDRGKPPAEPPLVQINRVRLMDVGPVTEPAYDGTSVYARSVPEEIAACLTRQAADEASEEAAELVMYQTMRSLVDACNAQCQQMSALVDALIADETESPTETPAEEDAEETVETSRLEAIRALCSAMMGTCQGIMGATYSDSLSEADDEAGMPMRSRKAARAAVDALSWRPVS